jgi:very-short-patch-repair endonuclease
MANERARSLRKSMTPQEVKLWVHLRSLRTLGHHFRRQSPLPPYIVDFECRRCRLIIEIDGGQHNEDQNAKRDRIRDAFLADVGYRVLRFWYNEIDRELDGVLEAIMEALGKSPHPAAARPPSPKGEG